jgi:D-alanyl-D-alanine carboxypeptidase
VIADLPLLSVSTYQTPRDEWLDSLEPQDAGKPHGQKYGYGISQITFGPNSVYFHGGEMPGYNSIMGYDPVNDVTLIIWTSLTISLDGSSAGKLIEAKAEPAQAE